MRISISKLWRMFEMDPVWKYGVCICGCGKETRAKVMPGDPMPRKRAVRCQVRRAEMENKERRL